MVQRSVSGLGSLFLLLSYAETDQIETEHEKRDQSIQGMAEVAESTNAVEPTTYQRWLGKSKLYEIEVVLFGSFHVCKTRFVGLAPVLGNRAIFWNNVLASGYNTLLTNTFLTGGAFI